MRSNPSEIRPEALLREVADILKAQGAGMSVRAVSRRLGVTPSYWSKVLRGERPLSRRLFPQVVRVLGLDAQQIARLQRSMLNTLESEHLAPATGIRTASVDQTSPVAGFKSLGREEFWLLEEWYYFPLLNLFTLSEAPRSAAEVARRLGLAPGKVEAALRRLVGGGYLCAQHDGGFARTELQFRFPTSRSHAQVRQHHVASIQKAVDVLNDSRSADTFDRRLISSVCFAGSSAKLAEAKLILEEAMYRAARLMAESDAVDEVYQMNVQVFPVTK